MRKPEFVDPAEIFTLHPNQKIQTYEVGSERILVTTVDNFYKYPDQVRNLFLKSPAPIWKSGPGSRNYKDYYDSRHIFSIPFGFRQVTERITEITKVIYGFKVEFPDQAISNVFQLIKKQPSGTSAYPHVDGHPNPKRNQPVNALIFLNKGYEIRGGTAFFRHLKTGRETVPMTPKRYIDFMKRYIDIPGASESGITYWCEYQKYWEPFHVCEMKYNRLIIFPSRVFHGAWHEPNWFQSYPRLNQVFFSSHEK